MSWGVVCGKCGRDDVEGERVPEGVLWTCPDCGDSMLVKPICPTCGLPDKRHESWCPRHRGEEK